MSLHEACMPHTQLPMVCTAKGMAHAHDMHGMSGVKPGSSVLTLRVRRVARRASGGRRSFGMLILRVEMALSKVMGTGRMCISALPSLLMGMGLPAAGTQSMRGVRP